MSQQMQQHLIRLFIFCLYFGYGAFFPMIGLYLKEQQLSGSQIGIIVSISPLVMLVCQPIWGLVTDYTRRPRLILLLTSICTALLLLAVSFAEQFTSIVWLYILMAIFQSALNPLSDSVVVNYAERHGQSYGDYRLWGAVSFALAAWLMGQIGETSSLTMIFYLFAGSLVVFAVLSIWLPKESNAVQQKTHMSKDLIVLLRLPAYWIFLLATFCILGPMLANNTFFGFLYQFVGGTLAGVGLCFLIGAGSEAPFMKVAGRWIQRYGYLPILLFAGILSAVQYIAYSLTPSVSWMPWITVLQGFSIGLFIPASVQMAGALAPPTVQTTAIAVYNAVAYGIATWFFVFIGGLLMDTYPVTSVYWFFSVFTVFGVVVILSQWVWSWRASVQKQRL